MKKNKKMQTKSLSREMQCLPCLPYEFYLFHQGEISKEEKNISSGRSIFHYGKKIFLIIITLFITVITFAQPLPGEDPSGTGADPLGGGGAPIGSGLFILLGLGAAYGGKKIYDLKKKKLLD